MSTLTRLVALAGVLAAVAEGRAEGPRLLSFDEQRSGEAPAGFTCALTGGGRTGVWRIVEDPTAPSRPRALAQLDADATSYRFPVCVLDGLVARNVDVSVRFKPVSGGEDQAAGLVWRYRDADNYYVARANALEGNVVAYKIEGGKRTDLKPRGAGPRAYGKKAAVAAGSWGVLRVVVEGGRFRVFLGTDALFEVEDASFPGSGRVGLWTKADSVTYFDDFRIDLPRE